MRRVIPFRLSTLLAPLLLAAPVPAHAQSSGQMPEHKITQSDSYIMIEPLYATIADEDRPCGMLMVAIGLDIPDPVLRQQAQTAMPLLRDDYVRSLATYAWTHVRVWEQPDVNDIARRLQRVTDRALHRSGARVLLAEVAMRITR